jgi:hypothetical protein
LNIPKPTILPDRWARSSEPLADGALTVLDARGWTRLVHFSQAKKRIFEILPHRLDGLV